MSIDRTLELLDRNGYVTLESILDEALLDEVRSEVLANAIHDGRNDFEGTKTRRVYSLLDRAPSSARLAEHPVILELLDRLLRPGFLLSANLAIDLRPGETRQPWHADDSFYLLDRPRPPVSYSVIWAIDAFTAANGATEVIPGSHRWGDEHPTSDAEVVTVEMPAGSAVVFSGCLWHRGGANLTSAHRLAITPQYCEPWARQQENMMQSIPPERARRLSPRLQGMLGYSIHPPFMGHVDGLHPLRRLHADYRPADRAGTGELVAMSPRG